MSCNLHHFTTLAKHWRKRTTDKDCWPFCLQTQQPGSTSYEIGYLNSCLGPCHTSIFDLQPNNILIKRYFYDLCEFEVQFNFRTIFMGNLYMTAGWKATFINVVISKYCKSYLSSILAALATTQLCWPAYKFGRSVECFGFVIVFVCNFLQPR